MHDAPHPICDVCGGPLINRGRGIVVMLDVGVTAHRSCVTRADLVKMYMDFREQLRRHEF